MFKTFYCCLVLVWNCSDKSKDFGKCMFRAGFLSTATVILSCEEIEIFAKLYQIIVVATIAPLGNMVRNCPELKPRYREKNIHQLAENLAKHKDKQLKIMAMVLLSLLTNEDEAYKLQDNGCIQHLVDLLKNAIASECHKTTSTFGTGFTALELLVHLDNIAINDSNKILIIHAGVLPSLYSVMELGNDDEKEKALAILWRFGFDSNLKKKVQADSKFTDSMQKLKESSNKSVRTAAAGALWELDDENHSVKRNQTERSGQYLFVSLEPNSNLTIILPIVERLKKDGYKVWINTDCSESDTSIENMTLGISHSKIALLCASLGYKNSPRCRSEGTHVFRQKLPIVTLLVEKDYQPNSWLGILVDKHPRVDFANSTFETAYSTLVRHISAIDSKTGVTKTASGRGSSSEGAVTSSGCSATTSETRVSQWSNGRVKEWVKSCRFKNSELADFMSTMDGEELKVFCQLRKETPEYFMKEVEKFGMRHVISLVKFLDKLQV